MVRKRLDHHDLFPHFSWNFWCFGTQTLLKTSIILGCFLRCSNFTSVLYSGWLHAISHLAHYCVWGYGVLVAQVEFHVSASKRCQKRHQRDLRPSLRFSKLQLFLAPPSGTHSGWPLRSWFRHERLRLGKQNPDRYIPWRCVFSGFLDRASFCISHPEEKIYKNSRCPKFDWLVALEQCFTRITPDQWRRRESNVTKKSINRHKCRRILGLKSVTKCVLKLTQTVTWWINWVKQYEASKEHFYEYQECKWVEWSRNSGSFHKSSCFDYPMQNLAF